MTRPLTEKEKRIRKQQKAASETARTVTTTKPEEPENLCDNCVYAFGYCEGDPTFASDLEEGLTGAAADKVLICKGFLGVDATPTTEESPVDPDLVAHEPDEEVSVEPSGPVRGDPNRFTTDTDYGKCLSCGEPLKRTAHSRYIDALRCVNKRCRNYRVVVLPISTGVR